MTSKTFLLLLKVCTLNVLYTNGEVAATFNTANNKIILVQKSNNETDLLSCRTSIEHQPFFNKSPVKLNFKNTAPQPPSPKKKKTTRRKYEGYSRCKKKK